jgi:leucine dehydrogenase
VGLPATAGGTGDPSGPTSIGVLAGLGATLRALYGTDQFEGRSFVVAGLGHVGTRIAARLAAEGGVVTVADVDPGKRRVADSLGVRWVEPDEAHTVEADVFVPSGVGGVLTETVIRELGARAVVGPANNPLADRAGADLLHDSGVLYAPDFVVNAGGAIYLTLAAAGVDGREIDRRLEGIGDTVSRVYEDAAAAGTTPLVAAEELAFARLRGERVNA